MRYFAWNKEKNDWLIMKRNISFDEVAIILEQDGSLDVFDHPNQKKYPGQKVFVVKIENYCYFVPCVRDEEKYFLKTIIPSRKATKKYILNKNKKQKYEIL